MGAAPLVGCEYVMGGPDDLVWHLARQAAVVALPAFFASTLANRSSTSCWMNVLPLAIPLTALLTCSNLCASSLRGPLLLPECERGPLALASRAAFAAIVVFAHRSRLPTH